MYKRKLDLPELVQKNSYFLFGPRTTGKSSLIREQLKEALVIDLLADDTYDELLRRPQALAEKIKDFKQLVVIDEIQKLPNACFGSRRPPNSVRIRPVVSVPFRPPISVGWRPAFADNLST